MDALKNDDDNDENDDDEDDERYAKDDDDENENEDDDTIVVHVFVMGIDGTGLGGESLWSLVKCVESEWKKEKRQQK